jgi:hypothetical protein
MSAVRANLLDSRRSELILGTEFKPFFDRHHPTAANVGLSEEAAAAEHVLLDRTLNLDIGKLRFDRRKGISPVQIT